MGRKLFAFNMRLVTDKTIWIPAHTAVEARAYILSSGRDDVECSDDEVVSHTYRRRPHEDAPLDAPSPTRILPKGKP